MKRHVLATVIALLSVLGSSAQLSQCDANVPFFPVNLTGSPDGSWESPSHSRANNCCGTVSPDRCTSFEIILDTGAAMINFEIASGAIPPGSMFYQIGCGPQVPVGDPICITGPGPHELTFCKPGNNENTYRITSIAKPIIPKDDSTRIGCTLPLDIYGVESLTITSVFPGANGAYDSYMSCTNCVDPIFEPGLGAPAYIDYQVCGAPAAGACGYVYTCDTFRVYVFDALASSVTPNPASFCNSGPGVNLIASGSGGAGAYSYEWFSSGGSSLGTGSTYLAPSEGNYTVQVSDALVSPTCPSEFTTVPVEEGTPPTADAGLDQTVCANNPTVYLQGSYSTADAEGAVWTGGAGTYSPNDSTMFASYVPTQAELQTGSVTLTLTTFGAGGGCPEATDDVLITFSDTVDIAFTTPTLLCNGATGTLSATASSGTAPYTYLWSTGSTGTSTTVGAGTYWLDVTDAVGCTHREFVTVSEPTALTLGMTSTDVSVDGGSDGTATATVGGGTPGYAYSWSNGDNTATATGLSYGIATVTVTDANGCVITGSVVVNEPQCLGFDVTATNTDVTCFGGNDGSASATASGGTPGYSYTWNTSPASSGANISGLTADAYTVTASDAGGCVALATVNVLEPTQLTNAMSHTDVAIIGNNTGDATANPSGGTPGYNYLWTPGGQTTQTISNLFAGTYYVDITDANLCSLQDSVIINEPPCNNFEVGVNVTNVSCNGGSNGTAFAIVAHGTGPYSYSWSDGQTGPKATGLAAGSYSVTVTDASNCTTFQNFTITEPSPLSIGLTPNMVSCYGSANGTIDLSVSGGTYPYNFIWMQGGDVISDAEDLVNMGPGTYSVTVTDDNGCSAVASVGITQPARITASASKVNATCNGSTDGSINATVSGGLMPYAYSWTGPGGFTASTEDISGLAAGLYKLNVTDLNGCVMNPTLQVYINEPEEVLVVSAYADCPAPGDDSTWITVDTLFGGSETDYYVSFDNGTTFQSLGDYSAFLPTGATYQIVAEDTNNCPSTSAYNLTVNPTLAIDAISFNPCIPTAAADIPVTVSAVGGDGGPYEVSSDGGATFNPAGTMTINLAVGTSHDIVVRDGNGCLSLDSTIVIPSEMFALALETQQVSCLGGSDGEVDLTVTGGVTPYSYAWTGPSGYTSTVEDPTGLIEGTYDVTVTDDSSCTTTASVNVTTFPDVTPPSITCPGDFTVSNDAGVCGATVNYTAPVGTDNCSNGVSTVMTAGLAPGSVFPVGTTTVTYTVTDSAGNTASCSFNVTVNDTEDPTVSCPATVSVNADAGLCEATGVSLGTPTTNDNCGVATVTNDAPATFPVGTTVVTWTVTDINGNSATCTQQVTVTDAEDPTITCPGTVNVNTDPGVCYATGVTLGTPVTADNCASVSVQINPPTQYPVGTTTVTWVVEDAAGNTASCTQDVIVVDIENPTITCAADVTVSTDPGVCEADASSVSLGNPTTSDNCAIASLTNDAPATYPVGTTTVTWTVTDVNGNSASCTQDVTVIDDEDPVITTCAAPVGVTADAGACEATGVTLGTPTVNDNCGVATVTNDAPASFPVGTTTVTWTITDVNGNVVTCTQDVTVTDAEAPTITCPATVNVTNDAGVCYATGVTLGTPTTNDNCGVATVTNDAPTTYPVGTTTVTWTVTDVNGNSVTCTQDVVVTDAEMPTITCGANVIVNTDPGVCETDASNVSLGNPITADNCGVASVTNDAPAIFPVGTTTVTWTVTDVNGNTAVCTQDVIVVDNEDPTFLTCLGDQTVAADANCEFTLADYTTMVTYNDNCGATVSQSPAPGTVVTTGSTTVTITITDPAGNTADCVFEVIVNDSIAPVIAGCPADITVGTDPGVCEASVSWTAPTASDNCGVTMTSTYSSGDIFPVGTTTVMYVAEDAAGNTDTCTFDVTVNDTEAPTLTFCQPDTATCDSVVFYNAPTATDNCGIASVNLVSGLGSGATFPVGTSTETWEVTDIHGNVTTCQFNVTVHPLPVIDLVPTDVTCYGAGDGSIDATITSGTAPYTYAWSDGSASEDISGLTPGDYILQVTDDNGCQDLDTATITQPDTLVVITSVTDVTCYGLSDGSIAASVTGGSMPYSYAWSNGDTTATADTLIAGSYSLTVTDSLGCTYSLTDSVAQPDTLEVTATLISATCLATDGGIDLTVVGGTPLYTYQWSNGDSLQDLSGVTSGTYSVIVTDANGCTYTWADSVLAVNPLTSNAVIQHVKCYGEPTGSIDLLIRNGVNPYDFLWNTGDTTQFVDSLTAGVYTVSVTDSNGCSLALQYEIEEGDSMWLELFSPTYPSGHNVSTYLGEDGEIDLTIFGGTSPHDILWSNGATYEDLYNVPAGFYTVVVTDDNGCVVSDTITLTHPLELELPTAFSPNLDGYNDNFVVHGIEAFEDNEILVYNRWGNLVYQKKNYQNEWDGRNMSGQLLPDATYFVIVKINDPDVEDLTGYVDLRRSR